MCQQYLITIHEYQVLALNQCQSWSILSSISLCVVTAYRYFKCLNSQYTIDTKCISNIEDFAVWNDTAFYRKFIYKYLQFWWLLGSVSQILPNHLVVRLCSSICYHASYNARLHVSCWEPAFIKRKTYTVFNLYLVS